MRGASRACPAKSRRLARERRPLLRHVRNDLALELALQPRFVEQVRKAADAQRVVEERHAAVLELVEDIVNLGQPELEFAREVGAIDAELTLDVLNGLQVLALQGQSFPDGVARLVGQPRTDAERIEQFEAQAFALI